MISFNQEMAFEFVDEDKVSNWISEAIELEDKNEGEINYIFCDDSYLLNLNVEFLKHDTYTDIISFDYSIGNELHGDIYISIERVRENASKYGESFQNELSRVMIHGVLHFCGYKDKTKAESILMRSKEDSYLAQLIKD